MCVPSNWTKPDLPDLGTSVDITGILDFMRNKQNLEAITICHEMLKRYNFPQHLIESIRQLHNFMNLAESFDNDPIKIKIIVHKGLNVTEEFCIDPDESFYVRLSDRALADKKEVGPEISRLLDLAIRQTNEKLF